MKKQFLSYVYTLYIHIETVCVPQKRDEDAVEHIRSRISLQVHLMGDEHILNILYIHI